ncbi:MAG: hypothetical protein A3G30_06025 [Chlamydiae bacterium RIFCSPLOWO2_12_FULL_49_12]|nr:MAG: hypothetical protein A3E26_00360 [Chlamydiae bacterium RIFCSPHIGHO2_12_FULL_49_32]OGN75670.1 MAG: hypothetical protein A3G30_06025 [Chlamydiae bacterium RIFCSPLOWO2_12_FULL_49_12]
MILGKIRLLKKELATFSRRERIFILSSMLCGFCICADYALVRPVSNALFITAYGSSYFAYAWLAMIPCNFLLLELYNRLLPRYSCLYLLGGMLFLIALGNGAAFFLLSKEGPYPFFYYIFKELYVMLLFQQLWAMIHATVSFQRAQYLYGLFFAVGALGGIFGSLIPGFFAFKMGSETLLLFSLPCALLLFFFYRSALTHSGIDPLLPPTKKGGVKEGFKQIASSKLLLFILFIVLFMQTSSSLIDFQFNSYLEKTIFQKDLRTEFTGRVMTLVNTLSFLIQTGGGFLLLSWLGLRRTHLLIPLFLLNNAIAFLFFPLLGMITLSFITIKAFDFSLFSIVKEMLYIPLTTEEKFHAKSIIDLFAYRSSKGIAAALILCFQLLYPAHLGSFVTSCLILLFFFWILSVRLLLKRELIESI